MTKLTAMGEAKQQETYYDVLKVEPNATIAEIVAAYHSAKNAFSKDSIATYSLFSPQEIKRIVDRLDEAFQSLSDVDRRRNYDRRLQAGAADETPTEGGVAPTKESSAQVIPFPSDAQKSTSSALVVNESLDIISGTLLKQIRESRSLSTDDVTRITKIPLKFLKAIENETFRELPARVYLQGFVKNIAALYKLDPQKTVKSYLEDLEKKQNAVLTGA